MAVEWPRREPLTSVGPATVAPGSMGRGTIRAGMAGIPILVYAGTAPGPVTVAYAIEPLEHTRLFPKDAQLNKLIKRRRTPRVAPATRKTESVGPGPVRWRAEAGYAGTRLALARVVVTDAAGKVVASRAGFISAARPVTLRLVNLPTQNRMIAMVPIRVNTNM